MTELYEDQEWARDLFDRSRAGEEPMWVADHGAMAKAGQRRNKIRTMAASTCAVAVLAVAAGVGSMVVGTGGKSYPPPADAPELARVFQYFSIFTSGTKSGAYPQADAHGVTTTPIPAAAAGTATALISQLDPGHSHIGLIPSDFASDEAVTVLADDDPVAKDQSVLGFSGTWTPSGEISSSPTSGPTQNGTLSIQFDASGFGLGPASTGTDGCGISANSAANGAANESAAAYSDGAGWATNAKWSPCATSTLADGSTLMSSSESYGDFVIDNAARVFPNGAGAIEIAWQNFTFGAPVSASPNTSGQEPTPRPDPATVLSPSPYTMQQLLDALSAPSVVPGLTPVPVTAPPAGTLQAADFGPGWVYDYTHSRVFAGMPGLSAANGCAVKPTSGASAYTLYDGTLPSGEPVSATATVYRLPAGSGASAMADVARDAAAGCKGASIANEPFAGSGAKVPVTALPAGIGDGGIIEFGDQFVVRSGDTIVDVHIGGSDTPGKTIPAASDADRQWLVGLARTAVARAAAAKG
jgi:hypothetical protein